MNFIINESEQKLRGGYYTPPDLAAFIARWVLAAKPALLLEPSCGDGAFVRAIGDVGYRRPITLTAFELFPEEAAKARESARRLSGVTANVHAQDFLSWAITQMAAREASYDGVVGNPPFVRYQYLPEDAQFRAEAIFKILSLPFTKHTNAWVPFVLASMALLKPGGRLGMILPAEVIHVTHAQSLRTYLGATCSRLLIIDPEEIWFDGTLQGAVILLAERKVSTNAHGEGLGIASVSGRNFVRDDPNLLFFQTARMNGKTVEGKWTRALLTAGERSLLDALVEEQDVHRFKDIAEVDVGIVTGANKFFLVTDEVVKRYALEPHAYPMFGRSEHCPGVIYDRHQHEANSRSGNPTNFVWLKGATNSFSRKTQDYIKFGEDQNLHTRYKCRVRTPWYTVPSVYSSKIGMLKRAHDTPRLILNRLDAFTTDTAYRISAVRFPAEKLVYCFLNSLTALTADLEGRHYGGGVLELVPSEIEKLLIPIPQKLRPQLRQLDANVREQRVESVLAAQDSKILGGIGVPENEQRQLLGAWIRLRNRRQRVESESVEGLSH